MSQLSHAGRLIHGAVPSRARSRRTVVVAGLLALVAAVAIVAVLVLDGNGSPATQRTAGATQALPSLRSDGGPEESHVAASVGSRPAAGPDESRIAASIAGASEQPSSAPDESDIAASIAGH
jgi:hypothetical protein